MMARPRAAAVKQSRFVAGFVRGSLGFRSGFVAMGSETGRAKPCNAPFRSCDISPACAVVGRVSATTPNTAMRWPLPVLSLLVHR